MIIKMMNLILKLFIPDLNFLSFYTFVMLKKYIETAITSSANSLTAPNVSPVIPPILIDMYLVIRYVTIDEMTKSFSNTVKWTNIMPTNDVNNKLNINSTIDILPMISPPNPSPPLADFDAYAAKIMEKRPMRGININVEYMRLPLM